MILPTSTTVAVANGETVRLFHNTGVKPGGHLVEITAAPPAPAHSGSGARHHTGSASPDGRRLVEDDFAAATAAFLNKLSLDGTIEHLVVVSDPRTLGEMRNDFIPYGACQPRFGFLAGLEHLDHFAGRVDGAEA